MGILITERLTDDHPNRAEFEAAEGCFACGKPLVLPAVYWQGNHGQALYLHPDCAGYLGSQLIVDGRVAGAQPRWENTGTPYPWTSPQTK